MAFHSRFSYEDFYHIETLKQQGSIGNAIEYYYLNWNGRWFALLLYYLVFAFVESFETLNTVIFIQHLASFFILMYSVKRIIARLKIFDNRYQLLLSAMFLLLVFFFSFSIIESWWWVVSTYYHLFAIIVFVTSVSLLLNKKIVWHNYLLGILCMLYIGASSETVAISILASIFVLLVYFKLRRRKLNLSIEQKRLILTLVACLTVSLLTNVLSPGVQLRKGVLESLASNADQLTQFSFKFYDAEGIVSVFYHPRFFIGVLVWALFFVIGNSFLRLSDVQVSRIREYILVPGFIVAVTAICVHMILNVYVFKTSIGPLRAWLFPVLVTSALFVTASMYLGSKCRPLGSVNKPLLIVPSILITLFIWRYILVQLPVISSFSSNYDNRYRYLKECGSDCIPAEEVYPDVTSGLLLNTSLTKEELLDRKYYSVN